MKKFKTFFFLLAGICLGFGCATRPTSAVENYKIVAGFKIYTLNIDGQNVEMVLDPESETTIITPELRNKLKINLLDVEEAQTSNHKKMWVDIVYLKDISVSGGKMTLFPVLVVDLKSHQLVYGAVDGILGKDFLQRSSEMAAHLTSP